MTEKVSAITSANLIQNTKYYFRGQQIIKDNAKDTGVQISI